MRLTTRSEYGLICLLYLCRNADGKPVSVTEITQHEKLPKDYVEQIFSKLRRAGIIRSQKGVGGGFFLNRPASSITVREVFEAVEEGSIFEVFCSPEIREKIICGHFSSCSVRPVWSRLKELIDSFCDQVTLDDLMQDENAAARHVEQIGRTSPGSYWRESLRAAKEMKS